MYSYWMIFIDFKMVKGYDFFVFVIIFYLSIKFIIDSFLFKDY